MLICIYFFIIGAFSGWLLECVFKCISRKYTKTPGILNTPFCILYGLGTVVLSLIINRVTSNTLILFIISAVTLTIMEYITFILLKKIYNIQLWNYEDMKFSINEKVCIEFSIVWGIIGTLYIKYLLPMLLNFYIMSQGLALTTAICTLFAIIILDYIYSSYILINNKNNSKNLHQKI